MLIICLRTPVYTPHFLDRITEVKPKLFTILTLNKWYLQTIDSHLLLFISKWGDERFSKTLNSSVEQRLPWLHFFLTQQKTPKFP